MDLLYSSALLISLIGGSLSLLGGLAIALKPALSLPLGRPVWITALMAGVSLALSVIVHRVWGHGGSSPEPMGALKFVSEHSAFLVSAAIMFIAIAFISFVKPR
jgi:hypothetical protein